MTCEIPIHFITIVLSLPATLLTSDFYREIVNYKRHNSFLLERIMIVQLNLRNNSLCFLFGFVHINKPFVFKFPRVIYFVIIIVRNEYLTTMYS